MHKVLSPVKQIPGSSYFIFIDYFVKFFNSDLINAEILTSVILNERR
jgi:hypothetical protein